MRFSLTSQRIDKLQSEEFLVLYLNRFTTGHSLSSAKKDWQSLTEMNDTSEKYEWAEFLNAGMICNCNELIDQLQ